MRKLRIDNDPRDVEGLKTWPWILFNKAAEKLEDAYPPASALAESAQRAPATMTGARECGLSS